MCRQFQFHMYATWTYIFSKLFAPTGRISISWNSSNFTEVKEQLLFLQLNVFLKAVIQQILNHDC